MPGNALDLLISHFGVDQVAEMTGRKMRIVTSNGRTELQQRARDGVTHDQATFPHQRLGPVLLIPFPTQFISHQASGFSSPPAHLS